MLVTALSPKIGYDKASADLFRELLPKGPAPGGARFLHLSAHPSKLGSLPNAKTPTIVGAFVRGMRFLSR
jgi:hypothetical protein